MCVKFEKSVDYLSDDISRFVPVQSLEIPLDGEEKTEKERKRGKQVKEVEGGGRKLKCQSFVCWASMT